MIVFLDEDDRPGQGFGGRGRKVNKTAGYEMDQIKEIELVQMGENAAKNIWPKRSAGLSLPSLKNGPFV
ncbi:MAG: hypothetical protein U0U70_13990 [Chitinophagaceae bacterium]